MRAQGFDPIDQHALPKRPSAKKDSHHRLEAQRTTSGLVLVVAFRVVYLSISL